MGIFVVQFKNLDDQISKLDKIVKDYDKDIKKEDLELASHNLTDEINNLKNFRKDFEDLITESVRPPVESNRIDGTAPLFYEDVFGNSLEADFDLYNYAEISYGSSYKFLTVRLLGVKNLQKIRYYITDLAHPFSPTTVKLLENIRDIIESRDLINFKELMRCKERDAWKTDLEILQQKNKDQRKYTWSEFTKKFLVPPAEIGRGIYPVGEMTDERRSDIAKKMNSKSALTREEAIENNKKLQAVKRELEQKADKDKEESIDIVKQLEESLVNSAKKVGEDSVTALMNFADKYSIGCIVKEVLECVKPANFTCKDLFKNLSVTEIFDRISLVFPRGSDTFKAIEQAIEKAVFGELYSLKNEVKEKEERIAEDERLLEFLQQEAPAGLVASERTQRQESKNILTQNIDTHKEELQQLKQRLQQEQERVFGDLQLSERQKDVVRKSGNVSALFTLPVEEDERIGIVTITDKAINAIDSVIPLEDLCEAITNALSIAGGQFPYIQFEGFPSLKFPEVRPINDIFSGISLEIGDFFVKGLVQGILFFLQGLVDQLLNCDNLDELIANIVSGEPIAQNSGLYGDLGALFGGELDFPNAKEAILQQANGFIENSLPYFQDILRVNIGSEEGGQFSTSIGIDAASTADLLRGEGDLSTFAAEALQQTLIDNASSNTQGVLDFFLQQDVNPLANWDISFDGEKFEISDGLRVVDIREFDKFFNSVSTSFLTTLGQSNFSLGALQDAYVLLNRPQEDIQLAPTEQQQALEETTTEQISNEFKNLFAACNAMLTPTEFIKLLAGKPTPNSLKLTKELMCLKAPRLCRSINTPSQIKNLFDNFGKFSGLGDLNDELEIIADLPEARRRDISPKLCIPYKNVDQFRSSLMQRVVDPVVANKIIDDINAEKVKNLNKIANDILNIGKGSADIKKPTPARENAVKSILDALKGSLADEEAIPEEPEETPKSLQDRAREKSDEMLEKSDAFQDILSSATHSLFNPIKKAFNDDIGSYIEFLSTTREVEKEVKRYTEVDSDGETTRVLTSEFRELLNAGLVPIKDGDRAIMVDTKRDNGEPAAGDIDGSAGDNYIKGEDLLPVFKKENGKIIGYAFQTAFEDIQNGLVIDSTRNDLVISIKGSFSDNNAIAEFSNNLGGLFGDAFGLIMNSVMDSIPRWNIKYTETLKESVFEIIPTGSFFVPMAGLVPFGNKYTYRTNKPQIDADVMNLLVDKYGSRDSIPGRKEVFLNLVDYDNGLTKVLQGKTQQQKQKYSDYLVDVYESFLSDFTDSFAESIKETSLLKEIDSGDDEKKSLVAIQLINFIREPTEQEDATGVDPHIFDFASLESKFQELYEKNKKKVNSNLQQLRGLQKRDSRFGKSANVVLAKMFIRLVVADYLFKTIFVSDYFNFSKYFAKLGLLVEHISSIAQNELIDRDVIEDFSKYLKTVYDEELQKGKVEKISSSEATSYLQGTSLIMPEIKKLVKVELNQLYCKLAVILGKEQGEGNALTFLEPFLKDIPFEYVPKRKNNALYDTSEKIYGKLLEKKKKEKEARIFKEQTALRDFSVNTLRSSGELLSSDGGILGRFLIEKYVKIEKFNKEYFEKWNNADYPFLQKFENKEITIEDFKFKILNNAALRGTNAGSYNNLENVIWYNCDNPVEGIVNSPIKYGVRLVYVAESNTNILKGTKYHFEEGREKFEIFKISEKEFTDTPGSSTTAKDIERQFYFDYEQTLVRAEQIYRGLKAQLFELKETKMLFAYTAPINEIASMFMTHSYFVHSDERMKYLFEQTKQVIFDFSNRLENIGLKNNAVQSLTNMAQKQKEREDNTGNPAGPIDINALKFFYRAPIQILKGLAALVDPNIFIADKIVMASSLIGALTGQKIFLPYSAASLALLPFPLFTGPPPIGIAPPLTAYNIAFPLGPIFLALEPLLWDLPWFKFNNSESSTAKDGLKQLNSGKEVPTELDPELLKCDDENEEENNN